MTPKFLRAIEYVLLNEGLGKVTDYRVDRGGLTKWGITRGALERYQRANPGSPLAYKRVSELSREDALEVYWSDFWRFESIADHRLAIKLFDVSVMMNPTSSTRIFQRALEDAGVAVKIDGVLGPATMRALNAVSPDRMLDAHIDPMRPDAERPGVLVGRIAQHHIEDVRQNPPQVMFLAGWLARAWRIPV